MGKELFTRTNPLSGEQAQHIDTRRTAHLAEGDQRRRDVVALISIARQTYDREIVTVGEVLDFALREGDHLLTLRRTIAGQLKQAAAKRHECTLQRG
ncbi:MAG: hypothetical protein ACD_51C00020G0001 [uncultured bacterium]|nr:MAG: hypothetical protein ACD_51C00020G0001 [uncultured bacterium]KKT02681.1 MAG: hypothetical protein UV80_C0002G0148 [Candidatus Peregrinibacteria bacterium GW2011_GWF2_43_17]KKT19818.1 MAG: hypothetical protein UW03_C0013G0018 [Candidatus Peregrinibacteria bacterium GW2011_GWA2_43_8]HAU39808.1 hypothetical protein [Candidatus Peregrinibacteria bacterium]